MLKNCGGVLKIVNLHFEVLTGSPKKDWLRDWRIFFKTTIIDTYRMIKPLFLVCGIAAGAAAIMQAGATPGDKDAGVERIDEQECAGRAKAGNETAGRCCGIASVAVERAGGMAGAGDSSETVDGDGQVEEIDWLTVSLDTPGELGVEILYQVDVLSDVKNLRVVGRINNDDWTTIKNIPGLVNLDLSQAQTTSVPEQQFYRCTALKSIQLPEGLLTIGNWAFRESGLTSVRIPSTVTYIGEYAFCRSSLAILEFGEDSALTSMGKETFSYCSNLTSVNLPDGLIQIPDGAFYDDKALKTVTLPSRLTSIGSSAFENTTVLEDIEFPETLRSISSYAFSRSGIKSAILPMRLTTLGSFAFSNCQNISEVRLGGEITNFGSDRPFSSCANIKRIECPMALPPKYDVGYTPFSVSLGNVELVVPDFAVVSYKLDSYWKNAGTITGGVSADSYLISGTLSLSNNRRIDGTPSLKLQTGSVLSVGGNAPMEVSALLFDHDWYESRELKHSQLMDNCGAITAERVSSSYRIYYNNWYFFSLPFETTLEKVRHAAGKPFALRYYDGANRALKGTGNNWKDVTEDMVIPRGTGLIIQTNQSGWITFDATADGIAEYLSGEGVVMPLAANLPDAEQENASTANTGWNYVGNPYQSYYDMYYTMLTAPVTVWDHYNRRYDAYSLIDENVVLHPSQSFFIQATGEMSEISFAPDGRQTGSAINRVSPRRLVAESGRALFNLTLEGENGSDRTRVVLNEQASLDYEPARDAAKFFSESSAIYTIDGEGNALAINERPADAGEVRLAIRVNTPGDYSISGSRIDGTARLTDLQTGTTVTLEEGESYDFHTDEVGEIENRFLLSVSAPIGTGIRDVAASERLSVSVEAGGILVEGAAGESIMVFTPSGAVAAMASGEAASHIRLEPGLYIVKAGNARAVKVIVK